MITSFAERESIEEFKLEEARRKREEDAKFFETCLLQHHPYGDLALRPLRWVIPGLLPEGYMMLLACDAKQGKTCLASAIALAVAAGTPFAGEEVKKGKVLWWVGEEGFMERKQILSESPEWREQELPIFYQQPNFPPLDTEYGQDCLSYLYNKHHFRLIVIDPLYTATSLQNLQEGHHARRALQNLKMLVANAGCAALVLHQITNRGAPRIADSIQLDATASIDALLDYELCEGGRIVSLNMKGRGEFANGTKRYFSPSPLKYEPYMGDDKRPDPLYKPRSAKELALMDALESGPANFGRLAELTKLKRPTLRFFINKLLSDGTIQRSTTDGVRIYTLVEQPGEEV